MRKYIPVLVFFLFPVPAQSGGLHDSLYVQWFQDITHVPSTSIDIPAAITTDAAGNVYVTGKSEANLADYDYLTIKYTSAGSEIWRATYDGPHHGADIPIALALSGDGDLFVTGMSVASDLSGFDIVTIKYAQNGEEEWIHRYDGPSGGPDAPVSIAPAGIGGAVVTGFQTGDSYRDIVTIRYGSSGGIDWIRTFDGADNLDDRPYGIVVDESGETTVCGLSKVLGSYPNDKAHLVLIRYDEDGNERWASVLDPDSSHSSVRPAAMEAGADGSLVLALNHSGAWTYSNNPYNPRRIEEIIVAKFGTDGNLIWSEPIDDFNQMMTTDADLATGITIDASDNIFLLGTRGPHQSYHRAGESLLIARFSPDGWRHWTRTYTPANGDAVRAGGIVIDPIGRPVVAASAGTMVGTYQPVFQGSSSLVLTYSADGTLIQETEQPASADILDESVGLSVSPSGGIVVAAARGPIEDLDFAVTRYSENGQIAWTTTAGGSGLSDGYVMSAVVDAAGNVYGTGSLYGAEGRVNQLTWRMDAEGTIQWWDLVTGANGEPMAGAEIGLTPNGRVVVLGGRRDSSFVTCYTASSGERLWSTAAGDFSPGGMEVSPVGDIILWRYDQLMEIDTTGSVRWTIPVSGQLSVKVDPFGNIYSCSTSWPDGLTKRDTDGNEIWTIPVEFAWYFFAIDDNGHLYGIVDGYLVRITPSGQLWWWREVPFGETFHHDGRLFVAGEDDIAAVDTNGTLLWSHEIEEWDGFGWSFVPQAAGKSFLTGSYLSESEDNWVIRSRLITPEGNVSPSQQLSGERNQAYRSVSAGTDSSGNFYLVGQRFFPNGQGNPFVVKYGPANITSLEAPEESGLPVEFSLNQNYPNPFNPSSVIAFSLPEDSHVTLDVYDMLGQKVATLVDEELESGTHRRTFDGRNFSSG
ncbi:MAG: T9SS type A sorting domain-containing protein, partial [Ignavibacteria bacterium]|nr:T9SS type A sorting domain-containing protein [Ignavibacteria bacterium]